MTTNDYQQAKNKVDELIEALKKLNNFEDELWVIKTLFIKLDDNSDHYHDLIARLEHALRERLVEGGW